MRLPVESVPDTRVCRGGCSSEPQPIANFYRGGLSANGIQLYQHLCKPCCVDKEKKRYHARPADQRRRAREKPENDNDTPEPTHGLTFADLHPCRDCGLRGHIPGDEDRCSVAQRNNRSTGMGSRGMDWAL